MVQRRLGVAVLAAFVLGAGVQARAAETFFIVSSTSFFSAASDRLANPYVGPVTITGLASNETPVAADLRPATGGLYLLTVNTTATPDQLHLYTLDTTTAAATSVGPAFPSPVGIQGTTQYVMDFNPVVDRIRVVASDDTNFRINPDTAAPITPNDTALAFVAGDPTPGPPNVVALAYDSNLAGASSTTLFGLDRPGGAVPQPLVRIGGPGGSPSPNSGQVTTIGSSGISTSSGFPSGLDVSGISGTAYAANSVFTGFGFTTTFYTANLATGAFTAMPSTFGGLITDFAVAPSSRMDLPASGLSHAENGGAMTVTVTRAGVTTGAASVDYTTTDGSAAAGSDYTATSGTLSFAGGETTKTFTIPVADDAADEGRESFTIELSNAVGNAKAGVVIGRRLATVTIEDNDAPPPVTPTPAPTPDTTKPVITLTGVPSSLTRAKFLRGFTITLTPSEPATFDVSLEGKTSKATLASIKTVLFSRHLKLASGAEKLKVRPNRKGVGRVRKTRKVTLRVVAVDAAGNRAAKSRTIRVKPDPRKHS